jgi:hypothetical protein
VTTEVLMEIEKLRRASLAVLREKYREVFREETQCRHRQHLFRRVAWRLQALAEGGLSERALQRAQEIARDADLRIVAPRDFLVMDGERIEAVADDRKRRPLDRRIPIPGTILRRQWKGRTILVEVLKDGFQHEGQHYSSLTAIAVAISGTRWNGMAFFGLTDKTRKERRHAK